MALDDPTEKMSKSTPRPGSKILLIDPPEVIAKKVRSAVTDSGRDIVAGADKPALSNLLTIFSAVEDSPIESLEERFRSSGYAAFKSALAEAIVGRLAPVRARFAELMGDPGATARLLDAGAKTAAAEAEETMARVWERVGLGPRS